MKKRKRDRNRRWLVLLVIIAVLGWLGNRTLSQINALLKPHVEKVAASEVRNAASAVINGFGKTMGTIQIGELGTLETPIALTNTLNVGLVHDALTGYMIDRCGREGVELLSVNPVVAECND